MKKIFLFNVGLREKKRAVQLLFLSNGFRMVLIFGVSILFVLYMVQITASSTKGFVIADLERTREKLERENALLFLKITSYRSLSGIQAGLQNTSLVPIQNIEYMKID